MEKISISTRKDFSTWKDILGAFAEEISVFCSEMLMSLCHRVGIFLVFFFSLGLVGFFFGQMISKLRPPASKLASSMWTWELASSQWVIGSGRTLIWGIRVCSLHKHKLRCVSKPNKKIHPYKNKPQNQCNETWGFLSDDVVAKLSCQDAVLLMLQT